MVAELERSLPAAIDSEIAMIGSIFMDNSLMSEALRLINATDFYDQGHRKIFATMSSLFDANEPLTPITVAEELKKQSCLESVGGLSSLTGLMDGLPLFRSIQPYAKRMLASSQRRKIIRLGAELSARGMEPDETEEQIARWAEERLQSIRVDGASTQRGPKFVEELIDAQLERFARMHRNMADAIPTGFHEIDARLTGGGLVRGFMNILAGLPSFGKTTLALDIAQYAVQTGHLVYFATLEMMNVILMDRLFAVRAGVPRYRISTGLSNHTLADLMGAADAFRGESLVIDDTSRSISQMRAAVRDIERKRKQPVDLIVVDYLQLMDTGKGASRNDQVGANARGLQEMAKEFNCASLVLSQLSRAHEQAGREPDLMDLRDSGEIGAHCRTAFFMFGQKEEWRDGIEPAPVRDVTFKCAKQGEGPLFRNKMLLDTKLVTFR